MHHVNRYLIAVLLGVALLSGSAFGGGKPKFEQPILITSAGQSADVTLVSMLCKKLNLNAKASNLAKPGELDGMKTLIIVAGFSSKGLGAAGISRDQEISRVKDLIAKAKEKKIQIMLMHIGGKPRRGTQSDDFNAISAEASSQMIVVKQGDEDQFFTKLAEKNKIAIDIVEKIAGTAQPLAAAFK